MTEGDLKEASREELVAIVLRQQAVIGRLERRIAVLEERLTPGGPRGMPGNKPASVRGPDQGPKEKNGPRKPRSHGFARRRMTPTRRVEHALETCPDCGTGLAGGWAQRSREVIEVPAVPVEVTEHVIVARTCPVCERRRVPKAALDGVTLGRQRLGINLVSLIATLKEEGRMPVRTIQWYLETVHQLHLSEGGVVRVLHQVAGQAQEAMAQALERLRASPVVQADETGWRQDGKNGYVWTFSTLSERYFLRRGRDKGVVDEVLDQSFGGVLVSDFYAAYDHYPGLKQRCWAHLLRDIHNLKGLYPEDAKLAKWAAAVHELYAKPESTDGRCQGWANWDEGAYKGESPGSIGTDVTRQRVFSSRAGPRERSMEAGNRVIVRSDAAGCTRGSGGREFGGVESVADSAVRLGVGWLAVGPGREWPAQPRASPGEDAK